MRLNCPSCTAAYDVPEARLGSGPRRLRCTRCKHVWTLYPPAPPPEPPPLFAAPQFPLAAGFPDYEEAPEKPILDQRAMLAWAASLLLLVGLAVAAVQFRGEVMHIWPPSQRLYAAFGATPD